MRPPANQPVTRRGFFRGAFRCGLAAGLVTLGGGLVFRRPVGVASPLAQRCDRAGYCRGCPSFTDCGLPPALSAKQILERAPSRPNL
jgi:hypothetical protein